MSTQFTQMLEHTPHLRRYARALCGNAVEGDALTHKTLECAKSLVQFRPKDLSSKVWLFSVMHNLTLDFLTELHGKIHPSSILPYMSPGDLDKDDKRLDIRGALTHLNLEQREIFLLVSLEQLQYEEVCQIMACNKAELITQLQHSREKMSHFLFEDTFEDFRQVQ